MLFKQNKIEFSNISPDNCITYFMIFFWIKDPKHEISKILILIARYLEIS